MAGTDGDTKAVENGSRIMGMYAIDGEGNDARLFCRIRAADNMDMGDFFRDSVKELRW